MKFILHFVLILFAFSFFSFSTYAQGGCDPCTPLGFNILENGDFENSNTGFDSDLPFNDDCNPGNYFIYDSNNNCLGLPIPDHSTGNGSYMLISVPDQPVTLNVWSQEVYFLADQEYTLKFWVQNINASTVNSEISINPKVDGELISTTGPVTINQFPIGEWRQYCLDFTSATEGPKTISLEQISSIAAATSVIYLLDDISLHPLYEDAIPCELIVQFDDGISQERKDTIRSRFDITVQDSCVCGNIDLWLINQFPMVVNGDTIIDIENLKLSSRDTGEVQDVDYNYFVNQHSNQNKESTWNLHKKNNSASLGTFPNLLDSCEVVVAVIDTGVDSGHPWMSNNIWDSANPCPDDGYNGYNFAYNNNDSNDDSNNGHGTHVAGIIDKEFEDNNPNPDFNLGIMPLKAQDSTGKGTLFKVICSSLFAVDNGADVINMSFGYRGDSTAILYNIVEKGLEDNEVIVVASAGNDAKNNDVYGHYPSNLSNPNLIAVAADTIADGQITDYTPYSCYGDTMVDLSIIGNYTSAVPISVDPSGFSTLNGTSMAAPQIAAAVAIARPYHPGDVPGSAANIKNIILSSGDPLTGGSNQSTVSNISFNMDTYTGNLPGTMSCTVDVTNLENYNSLLSIFPNPSRELLNISYSGEQAILAYRVYDMGGRLISHSKYVEGRHIDINKFAKGMYILEVETKDFKMRKRFVKM